MYERNYLTDCETVTGKDNTSRGGAEFTGRRRNTAVYRSLS